MAWTLTGNIKGPAGGGSGQEAVAAYKTTSTIVGTSLTDLCPSLTLGIGSWKIKFHSTASGSGTTGNTRQVRLTTGSGLVSDLSTYTVSLQTSSTAQQKNNMTALDTNSGSGTAAFLGIEIEGLITITTEGTLSVQAIRSGSGSWTVTAGASFLAEKLA